MNAVIDAILTDPLAHVRAAPRPVGYVGFDIPIDLLLAPPIQAAHLPWRTGSAFPFADRWLEAGFPMWSRAMLEDWAAGLFDFMDHVLFTRGDDAAQRLYYYICELRRRGDLGGPEPLIFDVARINRAASVERTSRSVRHLADRLGLCDDDLGAGIALGNHRRETFAAWEAARGAGAAEHARIARASLYAPVEALIDAPVIPEGTVTGRVLLAGNAPPDEQLHRAVEAAGWSVTGDAHDLSLLRHGPAVAPDGDPAQAIGRQAQALPLGARSFADYGTRIAALAEQARADVVIFWHVEEDEARVWQLPAQLEALERAGIPTLVLTRRQWWGGDDSATRIQDFLKDQRA